MTTARIIEAVGSLLWPLLAAVVLFRVAPHVPGLVAELRRAMRARAFTVKVGPAELTVEEATEQLRRQVADLQTQVASQLAAPVPPARPGSPGAAGPSRPAGPPGTVDLEAGPARGQGPPTVLWVDDDPSAAAMELAKLREDGLEVLEARTTAEAMDVLSLRRGVRAVVTDLGRSEDGEFRSHAGLALLRQLREAELDLPVLVYTSRRRAALDGQEALDAGAMVVTSSPTELLAALGRALAAPTDQPGAVAPPQVGPADRRPRRPIRPG
jgi:CheY-like chemotaxis protein